MVCTKLSIVFFACYIFFSDVSICPPFDNHRNYYMEVAFQTFQDVGFLLIQISFLHSFIMSNHFFVSVSLQFQHVNCYLVQLVFAFLFFYHFLKKHVCSPGQPSHCSTALRHFLFKSEFLPSSASCLASPGILC